MLIYRRALIDDLDSVSKFTDWWVSGRGKAACVPGAVNDCFISKGQHEKYITKYETWLAVDGPTIWAWAVVEPSGTLIHLLVAGPCRGFGIGSEMMALIKPKSVRSKMDQTTGDPIEFYKKFGYRKVCTEQSRARYDIDQLRPDRASNIDVLERP